MLLTDDKDAVVYFYAFKLQTLRCEAVIGDGCVTFSVGKCRCFDVFLGLSVSAEACLTIAQSFWEGKTGAT
jgi:hypothetical protein